MEYLCILSESVSVEIAALAFGASHVTTVEVSDIE